MTRTSVIIPLYNGERWLPACLAALRAAQPDEIIVVDDGSPDGGADWVEAHAPEVRLLRLPANRGYAVACNLGLRAATGDVLVLLNQDTEVEESWLSALVDALADPSIAFVGSRASYPDGRIQHAGGWVDVRGEAGHYHEERAAGEVGYVSGASIALRRDTVERLGGLDERFVPAYFEDVEWCLRARLGGLRVWYEPRSRLVHHEESQLGTMDESGIFRFQRNRLQLVLKLWSTTALVERFVPAERAWLEGLERGGERMVGVMHRLYLHFLVRLERYSASPEEAEARAMALMELLSVLPARPTELPFRFEPERLSSDWFPERSSLPAPAWGPPHEALDRLQRTVAGESLPPGLTRGSRRWLDAQLRRLLQRLRTRYPGSNTLHALTIAALDEQRIALAELAERLAEREARIAADEALFVDRFGYHEQRLNHAHDVSQRLVEVLLTYLQATNHNVSVLGHKLLEKSAGEPDDGTK